MTGKIRYIGFALLAALLALSSCRDLGLEPVFYALSQEIPLGDDKGFPDEASVFRMVKFNDSGTDYYLAAAGRLYIRGVLATDTWTVVAPPAGLANAMCNTLEILGTDIYAGFYDTTDGSGYGLWTSPAASFPSWAEVTDPDIQSKGIALLKAVGADLFVSTHVKTSTTSIYALYYGSGNTYDAVSWSPSAPPAEAGFIDVAGFGGSYWILAGAFLYRNTIALPGDFGVYSGGTGSPPVFPLSGPPLSGGLFADGINALYVSAGNGHLYRTADSSDWTRTTAFVPDDDGDAVKFTAFADGTPGGNVYVGTQGQGYYRIAGGTVNGVLGTDLVRQPAYNITALYSGSVNCFFHEAGVALFLGTNGSGLWRGDFIDGSVWTWKQE